MSSSKPKVFNLSYHRNATKNLNKLLQNYGYKSLHNVPYVMNKCFKVEDKYIDKNASVTKRLLRRINTKRLKRIIGKYDAFGDNPFPPLYRYLDTSYPDAKFIIFIRDENSWVKSISKFKRKSKMRKLLYRNVGRAIDHPKLYKDRYLKHNQDVQGYFEDSYQKLLVIKLGTISDIEIGNKIGDFLGIPQDQWKPFPKANKKTKT